MRFLVIGCGSIGRRHLRNLRGLYPGGDIAAVDISAERLAGAATEFGATPFSTVAAALSEFKPDVAFICTPTAYHIDSALEAAGAGCHLFIEKPLSHSPAGIDDLVRICAGRKLVTMVGSNWKFHPSFNVMKAVLDEGRIGRVLSARCQFGQYLPDWHPGADYRAEYSAKATLGGGILLDSHEFDYLTWFLGEVDYLACAAAKVSDLEIDTEDTAEVVVGFRSGAVGEIHLDYTQRDYQRDFQFNGAKGTLVWTATKKAVEVFSSEDGRWVTYAEPDGYDLNTMYIDELRHFLDCVAAAWPTISTVERGAYVLSLILAAKRSAAERVFVSVS